MKSTQLRLKTQMHIFTYIRLFFKLEHVHALSGFRKLTKAYLKDVMNIIQGITHILRSANIPVFPWQMSPGCYGFSNIPSFLCILQYPSLGSGFMKMSANCSFVGMNSSFISPLRTWSFRKWCLILISFVLECCTGSFDKLIILELSHLNGTLSKFSP